MSRHIKLAFFLILLVVTGCSGYESGLPESHADGVTNEATYNYLDFFAEESVHDLYVELAEEDWQDMLENPDGKEYCQAGVSIDGIALEKVGFRTKGNSSLRMTRRRRSERYPFHIKFDKYVNDQNFLGLDEIVMNNSTDDASYIREYLGYEAFRQIGMEAPKVSFFNVYINGELHGLYVGVEAVDNSFLDRVFGEHKGSLYKADVGSTLKVDMDMSRLELKKGSDKTKKDLAKLIRVLDATEQGEKGDIETVLDVDSVLKSFAVNAAIHNWDDYAGQFAHNFYLYMHDGIFRMTPWDMNEGFLQTQAFYRESDGARQDITTPLTGGETLESRPLVGILSVPEYYDKYLEYCEILSKWLDGLDQKLPALRERIRADVENDPTAFFSYQDFERQFDSSYSNGLAGYILERSAYLNERLAELY